MPRQKSVPEPQVDEPIYLSPSSLNFWYSSGCPAAWEYSRQWEPKAKNEFAERGILVHAMLDGSIPVHTVTDKLALSLYQKLDGLRNFLGLNYLGVEVKQRFPILDGKVVWTRIVDAIAESPTLGLVIVDYKTTGGMWKSLDRQQTLTIPQSQIFQTPGCLMPPPDGMWKESPWPLTMLYLVAPYRGTTETFVQGYSDLEIDNLLSAADLAASAIRQYRKSDNNPPKVRGKHCLECPFRHPCYNEPGWRKFYTKRKGHSK